MAQSPAETLVFQGSAEEQALAQQVFDVMTRSYGALFAREALVRQSLSNLSGFLAQQQGVAADDLVPRIDAVVRNNSQIFAREERDGDVIVTTSRAGRPIARGVDNMHTFRDRLYEPLRPLPVDDLENIVTTVRQVIPAPEPVLISSFWRGAGQETVEAADATPVLAEQAAPVAPLAQPVAAPIAPVAPTPAMTAIVLSDGTAVDLSLPFQQLLEQHGPDLQAEVRTALEQDPLRRVVSFGDRYFAAEALPNFGKNDLRRIRDFILEQGEPISDAVILTDLYRERPTNTNFDMVRFALDYRLSRERDFEFVGMPGANLWSAKGLPAIGGKRLKASDLGQLYGYLADGYDDAEEEGSTDMVLHTLTFFEWVYGVLPLDASLRELLPDPLLDDQRTAVIRIESPQHYSHYVCEVRYPTGARGGWVWGLEHFFQEYLVPGVAISFTRTDEPNVFTATYDEAPETEAKLLHLDEKRNRFAFMSMKYYAAVDEELLPSQGRYGKLRNLKVLPMTERKKADAVLAHVFEMVGEQLGSKEEPLFWITFDELHLALNVLRPFSRVYLTHLLSSDAVFNADETTVGAWYYKPTPEETVAVEEDDEDVSVLAYDEDDE